MTFSIRAIIRAVVAPDHRVSCARALWEQGLNELRRRGGGVRESGAFLLGRQDGVRRRISRFAFYDDLDTHCLDSGIVTFDGAGYGPLWSLCRTTGLTVIGDIHTHPGVARQSSSDRTNPMVATPGHLAIIVPRLAQPSFKWPELGIYEYLGQHRWHEHSGAGAARFFYVGFWG